MLLPLTPFPGPALPADYAFSGRSGGGSEAPYASLNLGHHVGDDPEKVDQNRQRLLARLGRPDTFWRGLRQVHGSALVQVDRGTATEATADALWTTDPQVSLGILTADCLPLLLVDRRGRAVAAVHAGWRGLAADIPMRTVQQLAAQIDPADWRVLMGPAIGPCCFEVQAEVAIQLRQVAGEGVAAAAIVQRGSGYRIDLWQIALASLGRAGVPPSAVGGLRRCTACDPGLFSYRRAAGQPTGRQAGVVGLKMGGSPQAG
jgi:YfiH family protein